MTLIYRFSHAPETAANDGAPDGDARGELTVGVVVAVVFFVLIGGWAAFAPLDAASVASGSVTVAGRRQTVQSLDGGVISGLYVHEGDRVRAGQVLIRLAATEARANERGLASRVIYRQAEVARLQAELAGRTEIAEPAEFKAYAGPDRADALAAMKAERTELAADVHEQSTRRGVLNARIEQTQQEISGYQQQAKANQRQQTLNNAELDGLRDLAGKGFAPLTRVRAAERTAAGLEGDRGAQTAEIATEDSARVQQAADELRKAQSDLQGLLPQWRAARDQVARADIKAPADGAIVGLSVNTVGAVISTGARLMEIVPEHAGLVIEAEVTPKDAASLKVGQKSQVRFTAAANRSLPVVTGVVKRISADILVDERSGRSFYTVEVGIAAADAARLARAPGGDGVFKPGEPVQVLVPSRSRSALQYWLEPLSQAFWGSFHQS
jgi:HlyD family secretion protein